MNKKFIISISIILIFLNFITVRAQNSQGYGQTDVKFKLKVGFLELTLQTYELFQNQLFMVEATVKTNESLDANTFNVTLELPNTFVLVNDNYDHPNPPINGSTGFQWITTWVVNSSNSTSSNYTINATENLYLNKKSEKITINSGPNLPYTVTVTTNKASYSFGETGSVSAYIFDSNDYPFNVEGKCNSTIYYPDTTSTSFKNVLMTYVIGSNGNYISSSGFQAWNVEGIYEVEVNCTNPDVYSSNTFTISSGITTTTPVITQQTQIPDGGGGGGGPHPTQPTVTISNFSTDIDLIKVSLSPGKTDKKSIKVFNNGKTKLNITEKLQYLDQLSSFKVGKNGYWFELNPNETKEIEIDFFAKKDQEAGVYPGKVIFTSEGIERTVSLIVEVESEKPLFDLKVETLPEYKMIYPGNDVKARLTIYNLGKVGNVNVSINYGIKDLSGKIIIIENETLQVETQISIEKTLKISSTLKPDKYVFFGEVNYKSVVGTGSDVFQVLEKTKYVLPISYFVLILLAFLILLLILIIYFIKKHKSKQKKKVRNK